MENGQCREKCLYIFGHEDPNPDCDEKLGVGSLVQDCGIQQQANCELAYLAKTGMAWIVATRSIPAGAEICLDYGARYWLKMRQLGHKRKQDRPHIQLGAEQCNLLAQHAVALETTRGTSGFSGTTGTSSACPIMCDRPSAACPPPLPQGTCLPCFKCGEECTRGTQPNTLQGNGVEETMGRKEVFYCSKWCRTDGYEQVVRFRLDAACDAKNRRRLVTCPAHFSLDAAMCVSDINHLNRWLELRRDHPKEFMDDLFEGGLVWHEPWMDFNEQRSSEDIMSLIVKALRDALDYAAKLGVLIVLGPRSEAEEYWPDNTWQMSDLWSATITAFLEADTKACEAAIRADRRVPNNLLVLRGCLTAEVPLLTEPAQTVRASHCTGRGEEGRLIEEVRLTDLRADLPTYMRLYLSTYLPA